MATELSAAARALTTFEILENILVYLPWHNLYTLQRTSSLWSSVITSSHHIQTRLFLRPPSQTIVLDAHRPSFEASKDDGLELRLNPLLELRDEPDDSWDYYGNDLSFINPWLSSCAGFQVPFCVEDVESSWGRMFVTLPPVRSLRFQCTWRVQPVYQSGLGGLTPIEVCNTAGVRFRDVFDAVLDWTSHVSQYAGYWIDENGSEIAPRSSLREFMNSERAKLRQYRLVIQCFDYENVLSFGRGIKLIETREVKPREIAAYWL